jgi:hypothetical protein
VAGWQTAHSGADRLACADSDNIEGNSGLPLEKPLRQINLPMLGFIFRKGSPGESSHVRAGRSQYARRNQIVRVNVELRQHRSNAVPH